MSKIIPLKVRIPTKEMTTEKADELVKVVLEMNNILILIQESLEQSTKQCKQKF